MFLGDLAVSNMKSVKLLNPKQETEWKEKLSKLPGLIGYDNIKRLKAQKEELDNLRDRIDYLEKQKALN